MKIYEVLWDEDEYGYDVAMFPPLVFTAEKVAEKAAKALGDKTGDRYFVRETELLDAVPADVTDWDIGRSYGCGGNREEAERAVDELLKKWEERRQ